MDILVGEWFLVDERVLVGEWVVYCIITPRTHARSGVKQSILSVSCLSGEKN